MNERNACTTIFGTSSRIPLRHEFVPRTSDRKQFGSCLDELQSRNHFVDGAETIPRAVYEHRWGLEAREVLRP